MKNIFLGAFGVLAVLGGLAFFNLTPFRTIVQNVIAGSAAGNTFNDSKNALVIVNLANPGTNGTSTSILNGDSFDRYVTDVKIGCESLGTSQTAYTGAGLASLQFKLATSSTANPVALTNTNLIGGGAFTIGTSSVQFVESSSTAAGLPSGAGGSNSMLVIWPSGTYLAFSSNATNTAACTIGVSYFGS